MKNIATHRRVMRARVKFFQNGGRARIAKNIYLLSRNGPEAPQPPGAGGRARARARARAKYPGLTKLAFFVI